MSQGVLGPACALGCSMTWAVGASLYSRLSGKYSVFAVNFTRAMFALPLFVATVLLSAGGFRSFQVLNASHMAWFLVSMICSYGLGDAFFMWSTRALGAPGALAICSIYPLWTAAIGLLRGDVLSWVQVLGVSATVAGVIVVILNGPRVKQAKAASGGAPESGARAEGRSSYATGVLLAFATSFFWAGNTFTISHLGQELDVAVANSVRMAMALVLAAFFGLILAPKKPILLPRGEVMSSAGIFVLESFVGSGLFIYGLGHSSLAIGSTLSSLAPVVSVPVALAMGTERFSAPRALGIVTVVVGLALLVSG